ncbi:MAG: hypothetical protein ABW042_11690, partial [Phenylobacterium sp.]
MPALARPAAAALVLLLAGCASPEDRQEGAPTAKADPAAAVPPPTNDPRAVNATAAPKMPSTPPTIPPDPSQPA